MPVPENYDPDADILPDELIDKHLDGGSDTGIADDPDEPEPDEPDPEEEEPSTPEEELEPDPEEEDDEPEGGEDDPDDDEEEEEDPDDDPEDDDPDDEEDEEDVLEDQITDEDRQHIKDDPALSKVHREMQRGFTKKMTDVAERDRGVTQRETRQDEFEAKFQNPDDTARYFGWLMEDKPSIAAAAFEAVAEGEGAEGFLVAIGENNPDLMEKVYDRVQEIIGDETERARYKRGQTLQQRESKAEQREQRLREQAFDRDFSKITTTADREGKRLGIDEEDMQAVNAKVEEQVRSRRKDDGSVELSGREVMKIVNDEKKALDKVYKKALARARKETVGKSQAKTKKRAVAAKRKGASIPKGSKPKRPKEHKAFEPPDNVDPMDAFVDHRLAHPE